MKTKKSEKWEKKVWFRAKEYGWGWYPVTWEGWAVLVGFIVVIVTGSFLMVQETGGQKIISPFFFPFIIVMTAVLFWICYKTGEKPEWRWGNKPIFKKK